MDPRVIGIVYELLGAYPHRAGEPPDAQVEYEPEATLLCLEDAGLGPRAARDARHPPARIRPAHA